jgi:hypothetical protein
MRYSIQNLLGKEYTTCYKISKVHNAVDMGDHSTRADRKLEYATADLGGRCISPQF